MHEFSEQTGFGVAGAFWGPTQPSHWLRQVVQRVLAMLPFPHPKQFES